jgi:hypothetical protein
MKAPPNSLDPAKAGKNNANCEDQAMIFISVERKRKKGQEIQGVKKVDPEP